MLVGISSTLLQRLQSVMNATAHLVTVFSARRLEHTTPLLCELHWLQVPERIQFRLCVLVHRCLNDTAQPYLAETLRQSTDVDARRRLRSAATSTLIVLGVLPSGGLMRGLATLPHKLDPCAFSGQRQGWKTPKRTRWQFAAVCVAGVHCWEISLG